MGILRFRQVSIVQWRVAVECNQAEINSIDC